VTVSKLATDQIVFISKNGDLGLADSETIGEALKNNNWHLPMKSINHVEDWEMMKSTFIFTK